MLRSKIRFSLAGNLCAAVLLSAAFGLAAPAHAQDLAWLGGNVVEVAPHRMGLTPFPEPSNHPLLGYLAKPDTPGRHPAVVVLHGCDGFRTFDPVETDVLKTYGYVALAIDSFDGTMTCTKRDASLAEAFDAYAALDWLARQDFVDPERIAVIGFSMGGSATLDTVEAGVGALEKAEKRHFRAAVAYYPLCTRYEAGVMTVPTLILVGAKDDWTPASYCREMMARRNGKGAPVSLIVYPGATHAFNDPDPPVQLGQHFGHHLAYDPQATAEAWRRVRSFLQTTLGRPQPAGNKPPSGPAAERR